MGAIRVWVKRDAANAPVGVPAALSVVASRVRGVAESVVLPAPLTFPLDSGAVTVCAGVPETDGTFYYTAQLLVNGGVYASKNIRVTSDTVDWSDVEQVDPATYDPLDPLPPTAQEVLDAAATVTTYAEPKGLSDDTKASLSATYGTLIGGSVVTYSGGLPATETLPNGIVKTYHWDASGNPTTADWNMPTGPDYIETFTYDGSGNATGSTFSEV